MTFVTFKLQFVTFKGSAVIVELLLGIRRCHQDTVAVTQTRYSAAGASAQEGKGDSEHINKIKNERGKFRNPSVSVAALEETVS